MPAPPLWAPTVSRSSVPVRSPSGGTSGALPGALTHNTPHLASPSRRVAPPAASRLEWVPAAELLAALDGANAARGWSAELR
eukprot:scaffold63071_cov54-Phaeocystis_antarctica.AAC.1